MAYPSDKKPRRRMQAVPTMSQMIRRRAASPAGALKKGGVGYLGPPVKNGGIPRRKQPQGNAWGWKAKQAGTTRGAQMSQQQRQRRLQQSNQQYENTFGFPVQQLMKAYQEAVAAGNTESAANWLAVLTPALNAYNQGLNPGQQRMSLGGPQTMPGGTPGPEYGGGGRPGTDPNSEAQGNPLEHQRYWASQGWLYDTRDQRFNFVGDNALEQYLQTGIPSLGGRPNPDQVATGGGQGPGGTTTGGDTTGGGTTGGTTEPPVTGPAVPSVEPSTDLPLDAYYEQQQRLLADQLAQRLGMIAPQREQVLADKALQEARLGTNETVDQRHMLESLAGRGAFGGGIQTRDQGYLSTDYLRQRQDLASNVAQALAGLSQGESEANLMYQQGLMEALLELANRQAMSEYAVTPQPDTTELPYEDWFGSDLPPVTGGGGGGGAGGGGGGGGGWEPTWKPTWKPTWQPDNKRRRRR